MAVLSPKQIYALAVDAGFPKPGTATTMTAIALAESGGRTDAVGHNSNGTTDTGLWQINSSHGYSQASLLDPRQNARAAKAIWDRQGYNAWVAFKKGTYNRELPKALDAASQVQGTSIADILKALPVAAGTLTDVGKSVVGGVAENLNPAKPLAQAVDLMARAGTFLANPQNWLRILYVGLGAALVIGALVMVTAPITEPVIKAGAKAADIAL